LERSIANVYTDEFPWVATKRRPSDEDEKLEVQLVRKQNEITTSRPAKKRHFILINLPVISLEPAPL
jgi:hypothetical protein